MAVTVSEHKLREYFWSGRCYKSILARLWIVDGFKRSLSWLKRKFKKMGLKRKLGDAPDESILINMIEVLMQTPYKLRGYRSIWRLLTRKYQISVGRDVVMKLMRSIDPEGVLLRRKRQLRRRVYYSKGPNYIWHIDGYDKLKPYGLCIHACVDGYSRKLIWFKVGPTNNNPKVIARYYLEAVERLNGCPMVVRGDCGTENCIVAQIQIAFRMNHDDDQSKEKSFIYGPSTANIRVEAFWSQWRRSCCHWWIDVCKSLVETGQFNKDNIVHRYTLALVFGTVLQRDMNEFMQDWNNHLIRKNKHTCRNVPCGRPTDLYDMPGLQGAVNCSVEADPQIWTTAMMTRSTQPLPLCPPEFSENALFFLNHVCGLSLHEIDHSNCRQVYLDTVDVINELCL